MHPRLLRLAAAAVLITAATATAVTASAETEAGAAAPVVAVVPVNPADYQQVTLATGVGRGRRADVAGRAARPLGAAHRPQRHAAPHRRRRQHHGHRHASRSTPTTRRACRASASTRASPPTGSIYLYYAPPLSTPGGDAPATGTNWSPWKGVNRLSRFTLNADYTLNMASEVDVLDVPADRGMCCHVGGDIDFDAAGNLYLSTGDDTNPFDSAGYAPIDERTNRNPAYDAQRSRRQHQRPARQGAADQGERERDVHDPGRQPVRARHRQHPARDLRDGLPQPVPDERRQGHRHRLPRRLRPGRGHDQRQPRPERAGRVQPDHRRPATTAGRTAPAPTPRTETYNEWTLPDRPVAGRSTTAPAARPTTRSATPARPRCPPAQAGLDPVRRRRRHARRSSAAAPSRRWAARSTATTPR